MKFFIVLSILTLVESKVYHHTSSIYSGTLRRVSSGNTEKTKVNDCLSGISLLLKRLSTSEVHATGANLGFSADIE